jgi:serine/threonine-protein kinase HipA
MAAPTDALQVFVYPRGALTPLACGVLRLLPGFTGTSFAYRADYLRRAEAFALDPFALPLRAGDFVFPKTQAGLLPPAFEDAAPDQWGRIVIERTQGELSRRSEFDYLAAAGGDRSGALAFSMTGSLPTEENESAQGIEQLGEIEQAAQRIAAGLPVAERHRLLLRKGTSLGGVRPKCVVREGETLWIAKFNARDENLDAVALEYAGMQLAAQCGIVVPSVRKVALEGGHHALLVARFDREWLGEQFGRIAYLSGRSLMRGYWQAMQGEAVAEYGYPLLAEAMRAGCAAQDLRADLAQLYRRMLFNILIDNTDDHEKNLGFLLNAQGWRLAPAFDLSSQLHALGYQGMTVGAQGRAGSMENALSECARFGLSVAEAQAIAGAIKAAMRDWEMIYRASGVDRESIKRVATVMRRTV